MDQEVEMAGTSVLEEEVTPPKEAQANVWVV